MPTLAQLMVKRKKNMRETSNSHYIYEKGGVVVERLNDICYASLRYTPDAYSGVSECRVMLIGYKKFPALAPAFKHYYDYVMHRSIFKDVFLNKGNAAWKVFGLNINTKVPPSVMMGGMTFIRQAHEFPNNLRLWKMLVDEHNFTEDEAAVVSCSFGLTVEGSIVDLTMGGHGLFDSQQMGKSVIKNFLSKKFINAEKHTAKNKLSGWEINGLFGGEGGSLKNVVNKIIVRKGEGWGAYNTYKPDNFVEIMRNHIDEVMK